MSTGSGGSTVPGMLPASMKYGASFLPPGSPSILSASGGPGVTDSRHFLSPQDPLLWVLGLAGLAVGLMFVSTTVRVGPVSAAVSAGKA